MRQNCIANLAEICRKGVSDVVSHGIAKRQYVFLHIPGVTSVELWNRLV